MFKSSPLDAQMAHRLTGATRTTAGAPLASAIDDLRGIARIP